MKGKAHGVAPLWHDRPYLLRAHNADGAWFGSVWAGSVLLETASGAASRDEAIERAFAAARSRIGEGLAIASPIASAVGERRETFLGGFDGRTPCAQWVRS